MVLNIRSPRADALARELADLNGTTITDAVVSALDDAVRAKRKRKSSREIVDEILKERGLKRGPGMGDPAALAEIWDEIHDNESRHF